MKVKEAVEALAADLKRKGFKARLEPNGATVAFSGDVAFVPATIEVSLKDEDWVPWCERCQSYHGDGALHSRPLEDEGGVPV